VRARRATIAYPATTNIDGSIVSIISIPYAAFSIVRRFSPVLTGAVCGMASVFAWVSV